MAIKKKWVLIINLTLITLAWASIIGLKYVKPEMSLKIPLFISSVITFACLVSLFGKNIKSKLKTEDKVMIKLSENEIYEIIEKEAEKRWNNLRPYNPYPKKISDTINNNLIYVYWVKLNLDNESFIIIINASHPELEPSIYPEFDDEGKPLSEQKIWKLMNKKSINPNKEPDTEERTDVDLKTGVQTTYKKTTHNEEKKEEDSENV